MGPGEQRHCANDIICILARAPKQPLSFYEVTLSSPTNQYRQAGQWQEWICRTMLQNWGKERNALTFFHSLCDLLQMRGYEKERQVWMDGWLVQMNKWKARLLFMTAGDSQHNPSLKTRHDPKYIPRWSGNESLSGGGGQTYAPFVIITVLAAIIGIICFNRAKPKEFPSL